MTSGALGCGVPWQFEDQTPGWTEQTLTLLGQPYWYNWKYDFHAHPRYNCMFWRPDRFLRDGVTYNPHFTPSNNVARMYGPARLWLLGNEPETDTDAQMTPQRYGAECNGWIQAAYTTKGYPTCAGGGGAIVNTPAGKTWFETFLNLPWGDPGEPSRVFYPYFHIHLYYMGSVAQWEADWNEYKQMCGSMIRPTIISETNLYNAPLADQKALMDRIVQLVPSDPYLHFVHWYAARDPFGYWPWCNLRNANATRTALGDHFLSKQ